MAINKVQYGNTTLIDLTDTTAVASDVAQGKYFYGKDGVKTLGTASGGAGAVIQDEDGGLHFLEDEVNAFSDAVTELDNGGFLHTITGVMASGGLEYEEGTWIPTEDTNTHIISLSNTHTTAPFYYMISDQSDTYSNVTYSVYVVYYNNYHQLFGAPSYISGSYYEYGSAMIRYRGSTADSFASVNATPLSVPYNSPTDTSNACSRFWATETSIKAHSNSSDRYFRAGRTYKWIAVWKPTA